VLSPGQALRTKSNDTVDAARFHPVLQPPWALVFLHNEDNGPTGLRSHKNLLGTTLSNPYAPHTRLMYILCSFIEDVLLYRVKIRD
jgi:hypothetical protein